MPLRRVGSRLLSKDLEDQVPAAFTHTHTHTHAHTHTHLVHLLVFYFVLLPFLILQVAIKVFVFWGFVYFLFGLVFGV